MSEIEIFNDFNKLISSIYKFNNTDVIYLKEYNVPVSNKYYFAICDYINLSNVSDNKFKYFFDYVYDETRNTEKNFTLEDGIDSNTSLEKEQFYLMALGEKNIKQLDIELNQFIEIVCESKTEVGLIIDIKYFINFFKEFKQKNQQVHLLDLIIYKLKKCQIKKIMIYDEDNLYLKNNLLYKQLEFVLLKNKNNSDVFNIFKFIKKINDSEYNIYWATTKLEDNLIIVKEIEPNDDNSIYSKYFLGKNGDDDIFICETTLIDIIDKNIFELEDKPGVVIDPVDKINLIFN